MEESAFTSAGKVSSLFSDISNEAKLAIAQSEVGKVSMSLWERLSDVSDFILVNSVPLPNSESWLFDRFSTSNPSNSATTRGKDENLFEDKFNSRRSVSVTMEGNTESLLSSSMIDFNFTSCEIEFGTLDSLQDLTSTTASIGSRSLIVSIAFCASFPFTFTLRTASSVPPLPSACARKEESCPPISRFLLPAHVRPCVQKSLLSLYSCLNKRTSHSSQNLFNGTNTKKSQILVSQTERILRKQERRTPSSHVPKDIVTF